MWRKEVLTEFVAWLREFNATSGSAHQPGFYGLDLYSLDRSRAEVLRYLERIDPAAASFYQQSESFGARGELLFNSAFSKCFRINRATDVGA
jgi:erythromycin esterase-like protein